MTLIVDDNGTRWVELPKRKRRAKAKRGRFSEIDVGDQLVQCRSFSGTVLTDGTVRRHAPTTIYAIVTDLWFDPVRGDENAWSGQMVGIRMLDARGETIGPKRAHSRSALASEGYHKADFDYIAWAKVRLEEVQTGKVVGIHAGHVIRKRPKTITRGI